MQLSEDPRFLGQGQAFREEGGWRRGAKGKRDHLGRGGVGQGECQRGAIQSGIQTGGTGGSSAWLARGGHCPDFRRDYLSLEKTMKYRSVFVYVCHISISLYGVSSIFATLRNSVLLLAAALLTRPTANEDSLDFEGLLLLLLLQLLPCGERCVGVWWWRIYNLYTPLNGMHRQHCN